MGEEALLKNLIMDLAPWMSVALDDPKACQEWKDLCQRVLNAAAVYRGGFSSNEYLAEKEEVMMKRAVSTITEVRGPGGVTLGLDVVYSCEMTKVLSDREMRGILA